PPLARPSAPGVTVFQKSLGLVGIPLLAQVVLFALLYLAQVQHAGALAGANRTTELLHSTQQLLTLLVDAETGQRGYLLTGDPVFKAPLNTALAEVPPTVSDIQRLADALRQQQDAARAIAGEASTLLEWQKEMTDQVEAGRRADAVERVKSGAGKRLM